MIVIKRVLRKIPEVRVSRINLWVLLFLEFLASHSVFTTVTWGISRKVKFVDEVGSTVFYKNIFDCHHIFFYAYNVR